MSDFGYTFFSNEIEHLFQTKYNKNNRYVQFLYNGYKHNNNNYKGISEFANFLLVDTNTQEMALNDNPEQVKSFLSLTTNELEELNNDLDELIQKSKNTSGERMLVILHEMLCL
jgi:hypothetical protein